MSKSDTTIWAALHREDGTELTGDAAAGYARAPYGKNGAHFGCAQVEWEWVHFVSAWDAPIGGNIISDPSLQPLREAWVIRPIP